jgi:hypothetical protein
MKLLTKQQVNVEVQAQRKIQIDEGLTLARKVDALREKLANLETQQKKFFESMDSELHQRTDYLFEEIASREEEIKKLEQKRAELIIPLDNAWQEVKEKKLENDNLRVVLDEKSLKLAEKEQKVIENAKKAKELLFKAKTREKEVERVYDKADQLKMETESIFTAMLEEKDKQTQKFENKEKKLDERENSIKSYEFTLKDREQQIEIKEQEIREEKIRLSDQRQTLERAMARIK